jgi:hypothetical protein
LVSDTTKWNKRNNIKPKTWKVELRAKSFGQKTIFSYKQLKNHWTELQMRYDTGDF